MTEKWELCVQVTPRTFVFYTPAGRELKHATKVVLGEDTYRWIAERRAGVETTEDPYEKDPICVLLAEGWEPIGLVGTSGETFLLRRPYHDYDE